MRNSQKKQGSDLLATALGNPLVQHLPPFMNDSELAVSLSNRPFAEIDWSSVPLGKRAVLLNQLKTTFCVTEMPIRIASALQSLLWDGLLARDPRLPTQRRLIYELAEYDCKNFQDQPWRPDFTGGITIRGITGVGKSVAVDRFLSLLPQVIQHGQNEAAQWVEFRQLVYLKVPMSADGSRMGFLQNCLQEMDVALGTDYYKRNQGRQWTVERLLVNVLHYLALHRCGLLIIEEAQERNLSTSQFAREFLTFFLRLLNHGVPVVIIGNPLAFSVVDTFSQDASRFTEYGDFRIEPVFDYRDEEWVEVWIPQLWGASLLDEDDEPIENRAQLIWNYTAGFPRFLARLRRESLQAAIQIGSSRVTREHIEIAWNSPSMQGARDLIVAFTRRDWRLLDKFNDIPIDQIRGRWEQMKSGGQSEVPSSAEGLHVDDQKTESDTRNVSAAAEKKTRDKNVKKQAKTTVVDQPLSAEDIRSQEYVNALLAKASS